jgi:hypothetical protein
LLYANQALAGEARVVGSISGAGGNLPMFHEMGQNRVDDRLVLDTGDYPGFEQIDTSILNTASGVAPKS